MTTATPLSRPNPAAEPAAMARDLPPREVLHLAAAATPRCPLPHRRPVPVPDLVGEAVVAFFECRHRFDPSRGTRLSTFAFPRMYGRSLDALRKEARQQRLRLALRRQAEAAAEAASTGRLDLRRTVAAVYDQLPSSERTVLDGLYGRDESLPQLACGGRFTVDQLQRAHRSLVSRLRERLAVDA